MRYGFVFPGGDARVAAEFAWEAEVAGWDGFFVWDPVWGIDPWVSLTACAMVTDRVRLGTMLTPISRHRPWTLAGATATLDRLSNGRVTLSVGLGATDTGFESFGEVTDRKTRAELLDEGLDIVTGLWKGQPFTYDGTHYQVKETSFLPPPPPVQSPRIPIWVVGAWPRLRSMRRVLRWDGILPAKMNRDGSHGALTPDDIRAMKEWINRHRTEKAPIDIVMEGTTPGDQPEEAAAVVRPWAEAGATWWVEAMWAADTLDSVLARIKEGPPQIERETSQHFVG